jgi:cytochrome bd-type quinol oxidase subunit 1
MVFLARVQNAAGAALELIGRKPWKISEAGLFPQPMKGRAL